MKYKDITKYLPKSTLVKELTFVYVQDDFAYTTDRFRGIKIELPESIVFDGFYSKEEWKGIAKQLDKREYDTAREESKKYRKEQVNRNFQYPKIEDLFTMVQEDGESNIGDIKFNSKFLSEFITFCGADNEEIDMRKIKANKRMIYYRGNNFEQVLAPRI